MNEERIELMIVGAQKAGTTSLKTYLALHPRIRTHSQTDFPYFIDEVEFGRDRRAVWNEHFAGGGQSDFVVAKSAGLMYVPDALMRLKQHNPSVMLVLILRNPVERAYSAFSYARRRGFEPLSSFEEALAVGTERFGDDWRRQRYCDYLGRGKYIEHLRQIYAIFPKDQVQVFRFEELKKKPEYICQRLFRILSLSSCEDIKSEMRLIHNSAARPRSPLLARTLSSVGVPSILRRSDTTVRGLRWMKRTVARLNEMPNTAPELEPRTREWLVKYFQPYNKALEQDLGWSLEEWNK